MPWPTIKVVNSRLYHCDVFYHGLYKLKSINVERFQEIGSTLSYLSSESDDDHRLWITVQAGTLYRRPNISPKKITQFQDV
jgi:hypothetical protein